LKPNLSGKYIIGVDLGGTNVRAAVTDKEGHILGQGERESKAMEGPEVTVPAIIEAIRDAISDARVEAQGVCGIGMGVPGRHRSREGIVVWSPNFKDWGGLQLLAPIRDAVGIPAYMGNDVNVAALGEFRFGAAKDVNSLVMLTLGTGIGGGVILDGRLWLGENEGGGEIGHQIINPNGRQCGCGNFGDLEGEAARDAIVERALRKIYLGRKTVLTERLDPKFLDLTPALIADAAAEGDRLSIEVLEETGYFVGIGVANAINFLNPAMVIIGGRISQAGDALWDSIIRTVRANALKEALDVCRVVPAALGDDAGILGGVVLVLQEMEACA
jgi:glucokinase